MTITFTKFRYRSDDPRPCFEAPMSLLEIRRADANALFATLGEAPSPNLSLVSDPALAKLPHSPCTLADLFLASFNWLLGL